MDGELEALLGTGSGEGRREHMAFDALLDSLFIGYYLGYNVLGSINMAYDR